MTPFLIYEAYITLFVQLASHVLCNDLLDSFAGIQQVADGAVVVQGINDVRNVLAEVAADIPFSLKQLRRLIDQVRGKYSADQSFLIGQIKKLQSSCEQTEGGCYEDAVCLASL